MTNVFIDGSQGTTGLRLEQRLSGRPDISLLRLPVSQRKDIKSRLDIMDRSDITFLCLPDEASREIVETVQPKTRIIDTSTAFRTAPEWIYGFPEISQVIRAALPGANRVSVPGCHATGYIALVLPLIKMGIVDHDVLLSCTSLTGYSGGGKRLIEQYRSPDRSESFSGAMFYAGEQIHKHLPEMAAFTGLKHPPVFLPVLTDCYAGMAVSVPLHRQQLSCVDSARQLAELYGEFYRESVMIQVLRYDPRRSELPVGEMAGQDSMILSVLGSEDRLTVTASYDNLGKGASGAAIQCLNLMLGLEETKGLVNTKGGDFL